MTFVNSQLENTNSTNKKRFRRLFERFLVYKKYMSQKTYTFIDLFQMLMLQNQKINRNKLLHNLKFFEINTFLS